MASSWLVGPRWTGQKPDGFIDVLRSPTNFAGVSGRSFTAHAAEEKAKARRVLNQIGRVKAGSAPVQGGLH